MSFSRGLFCLYLCAERRSEECKRVHLSFMNKCVYSRGVYFLKLMSLTLRRSFHSLISSSWREAFTQCGVFAVIFLGAKLGQYLFFTFHTSPALLWPPEGIALGAMLLFGYRMWLPIALGSALASITSIAEPPFLVIFGGTVGQTAASLLGTYIFKRAALDLEFSRTRDILIFLCATVLFTMVTPTLTTLAQYFAHTLSAEFMVVWTRSWAGRVLSVLTLTPFILSIYAWFFSKPQRENKKVVEHAAAAATLLATTYLLFWTKVPTTYSFVLIYLLFIVLFWIALRMTFFMTASATFFITVFGTAGIFIANASGRPFNTQVFSVELFLILIVPIFYILSVLVQERRAASRMLQENVERLAAAMQKLSFEDQSKNEFIAILAHELRNPLSPIMSTFEFLALQPQEPTAKRLLDKGKEQALSMRRILEDLLDVARVTQKKFTLQKETVELHGVLERCLESVDTLMKSLGHTVSLSIPQNQIWIHVDPVRFEQIVVNLLNNAAKYTSPGGQIELSCVVRRENLELSVSDNGRGIEEEELPHIFEAFRQGGKPSRVSSGLGIGLSLTKRLVEMHEGEITARSGGIGRGATFTLKLPVVSLEYFSGATYPAEETLEAEEEGMRKILIVDDNQAAAEGLQELLRFKGHEVNLAYDGESAIEAAASSQPHVVLLDIGLPDIDGYEVARRLRKNHFTQVLIALTGYGQDEDKAKARQAGFNYHITKPVGIAELESIIAQI